MLADKFGELVISGFETLTPDINGIYESAYSYTQFEWRLLQQSLVTGSGAVSVAIPFAHLAGLAADIAFLMNRMAVCSYGIGAILGFDSKNGNILEPEDFAVVLARWSGDDSITNATVAKTAAALAGHVGGATTAKFLAKVAAENAGILVGRKLGVKVGTKIGAKFGGKIGSKAVAGFFPFLGPAIGGGINLWFITSIASEAQSWYRLKLDTAAQRPSKKDSR